MATLVGSWDPISIQELLGECGSELITKKPKGRQASVETIIEKLKDEDDENKGMLQAGELIDRYEETLLSGPERLKEAYEKFLTGAPGSQESLMTLKRTYWKAGSIVEAEMMDPDYPDYEDTIHRVRITEVLDGGKQFRCKLLAFKGPEAEDVWNAEQLHEPREANKVFADKKNVHIRVKGREEDCLESTQGIWVKGKVVEQDGGEWVVEHTDWKGGVKRTRVSGDDIRGGW